MAVVNVKSTGVANNDAGTVTDAVVVNSMAHLSVGTLEATAAESATSVYRFLKMPSNARIHTLEFSNDALGSGTSVNIGAYETATNGAAAVTVSAASFALSLQTVSVATNLNITNLVVDKANAEKPLWQILGKTADTNRMYDICATAKATIGTTGTMTLKAIWAQ